MLDKIIIPKLALIQASLLVGYITIVAMLIFNAEALFDKVGNFWGPVFMLLTFVISAVISATIVLGRAMFLFWEHRYQESFTLLGWTVGWCILYLFLIATYLIVY